ncbi:SDR family oxidoreductase [Candidatus Entotheonella palauensis]|uniref:SDR family oxidoreductase n=1 Tax=Candidatus Entotheonella palauensis TaxID=93172 RepID=UPI000B7EBD46|nr:SDR family oxidoreductase [Candidatus Entotheonella palauensis]
MAHCLVTGGAGFIGSHLTEGLLRAGHQVRVLDDLSTGSMHNVQAVHQQLEAEGVSFSLETMEGSILAPAVLAKAMADIDFVFHQAALPSVAFSLQDPFQSNRVNVEGTLCVLMAAHEAGVKRVIYAGSSSAYGDSPALPKQEDQPPNPLSPYAVAKLTGEHYCRVFTHVHGLETVVLSYFNVFGTRQNPNSQYAAVIPAFITTLLQDQPLRVYGDGHQSRDFTYVANVVQGNMLAMTAPHVAGQVINLALGGRTSLLELIAHIEVLSQRRAQVMLLPPRAGDVKHSQADITRAKKLLGFETAVDVKEGLARTLAYYQRTP